MQPEKSDTKIPKRAVLLLAHGTPETVAQIPEYLLKVTGGRPLPQAVIEEIERRYTLIGHSPLTEITLEQGRLVEAELAASGVPIPVYVGMRNWAPYIADVVHQMRSDGIEEAAVICLAPQNSRTSVGLYRRAVESAAPDLRIDFTEGWATHPLLIAAFAERLKTAYEKLSTEVKAPVPVLFTAHSVPCRTVQSSPTPGASTGQSGPASAAAPLGPDPYSQEAKRTADLVAKSLPELPISWFAFQSQGASGGPWIGPTVEATLDAIAASGVKTLLLQPIGFLCDHVEILFDVDHLFRDYAAKIGIRLERPESLNTSTLLAQAVTDLVRKALARLDD